MARIFTSLILGLALGMSTSALSAAEVENAAPTAADLAQPNVAPTGPVLARQLAPAAAVQALVATPPAIAITSPSSLLVLGQPNQIAITGDIGKGERVYVVGTIGGVGAGPCIPSAGGLCLGVNAPIALLGSVKAVSEGQVIVQYTPPLALGLGNNIALQALLVRSFVGADSIASAPVTLQVAAGPPEGSAIADWLPVNFLDNGYRNGCAGGTKYVKSSGYANPRYIGVTRCADEREYKLWLSDQLYGTFVSTGDWSGQGQDQCEYVGGDFVSFPQPSSAVDAGQACWSRGTAGTIPLFEASCANNRWVARAHRCSRAIPGTGGPVEGAVLGSWTAFDFYSNGYRDGCAGGAKYIKSTPYASPKYVAVTLCSPTSYKIWLGDRIHGIFVSPGDWSGNGQDHCEYVGGTFVAFPIASSAVDAGQACWSRGAEGSTPVFETSCANNRWVPSVIQCTATLP